jgi:hypothetical protein
MHFGGCRPLILAALAVAVAGCGEASTTSTSTPAPAAAASPAEEAGAQRRAEAIFQSTGIDYYVGVLRPSTIRFSSRCPPAREGEEGHLIAGKWHCAGWGLISIEGGSGKPRECEFVEGNVTASGLEGKPLGNAMTFSGSPCQLNVGLGTPGQTPSAHLVAAWTAKQRSEAQHVKEQEASPSGQEQKHEEAKQEAEEAKRTEEAHKAERGE